MAKFGIFGKFFDKICVFEERKNGTFGGKILWSVIIQHESDQYQIPRIIEDCQCQ